MKAALGQDKASTRITGRQRMVEYTEAQNEAIAYRGGNLQIIACAGSGKTDAISRTIAELVASGIQPENIVAFTFTEKAAHELKLRIRSHMEDLRPDDPSIGTMSVGTIHSFCFKLLQDLAPRYRNYEVLDEGRRVALLARRYGELGLEYLDRRVPFFETVLTFQNSVDYTRHEMIDTGRLMSNRAFQESMNRYDALLDEMQFLDFSSMTYRAVRLLEEDENKLRTARETYKYLFVDEYQDINPAQERLIRLLAGDSRNLVVVGDDDQAIYEWRGAAVENMLTFDQRYDDVITIMFGNNFRSTNIIVECANQVIEANRNRLEKEMMAGTEDHEIIGRRGDVYKIAFETRQEEAQFIVRKIQELRGFIHTDPKGNRRPIDWGDFAILFRSVGLSHEAFTEALRGAEIPFTIRGTAGLFRRPEVNILTLTFCFLADMGPTRSAGMEETRRLLRSGLAEYFPWVNRSQIISWLNRRKRSFRDMRRIFPQVLYHEILEQLGADENRIQRDVMFDLGRLSSLITDFESVYQWITADDLRQLVFFLRGWARAHADEGGLEDPSRTNAVSVLTVHRAKGLQFPVVFIPDVCAGRFPSSKRNTPQSTYIPEEVFNARQYCSGDEGERRLFYVALTRSQKFLFITTARRGVYPSRLANPSPYLNHISHPDVLEEDCPDPTARARGEPRPPADLEIFPTSYSDLRYYLLCPYDYLLRKLMGFGPPIGQEFGYGKQVHNVLNLIHEDWRESPPSENELDELMEGNFMLRYTRGEPFERMKRRATELMTMYVAHYGHLFPLILESEMPFEFVLAEALISGTIDLLQRIDPTTGDLVPVDVIDFKTGEPGELDPEEGTLQVQLYAIGARQALRLDPQDAHIHHLSDNMRNPVDIGAGALERAQRVIAQAVGGIKSQDFPQTTAERCLRCDFRRICSGARRAAQSPLESSTTAD